MRQAEPQSGQDVGQRARQDDVTKQAAIVRPHRLRRAQPDFFDRFHAAAGIVDDRKGGKRRRPGRQPEHCRGRTTRETAAHKRGRGSVRRCSRAAAKYLRLAASAPSGRRLTRRQLLPARSRGSAAPACPRHDAAERQLSVSRANAAAIFSSGGKNWAGKTPRCATISHKAPTTAINVAPGAAERAEAACSRSSREITMFDDIMHRVRG